MSQDEIREFLTKHKGVAYTRTAIKKRIKVPSLTRKLNQQVKFGFIYTIDAVIDSRTRKNILTRYFYVGTPQKFVPRPKRLLY